MTPSVVAIEEESWEGVRLVSSPSQDNLRDRHKDWGEHRSTGRSCNRAFRSFACSEHSSQYLSKTSDYAECCHVVAKSLFGEET